MIYKSEYTEKQFNDAERVIEIVQEFQSSMRAQLLAVNRLIEKNGLSALSEEEFGKGLGFVHESIGEMFWEKTKEAEEIIESYARAMERNHERIERENVRAL